MKRIANFVMLFLWLSAMPLKMIQKTLVLNRFIPWEEAEDE